MKLPETPPNAPPSSLLWRMLSSMASVTKNTLRFIFTEKNPRPDILTTEFLEEFHDNFTRMCKERQEGIYQTGKTPTLSDAAEVNSYDVWYRMFGILFNQYPQLKTLGDDTLKVRIFLMKYCGLPGSGQM